MYMISTVRFEFFQKEFSKLVKFAEKIGAEIPTYTAELTYKKDHGYYYNVEVQGLAPKYDGWEFVARIDNVEHIITGLKAFPEHYYDDHGKCEHCNVNHARVKTYIIQKDNKFMEVGGSCLKQFTGGLTPEKVARHFDMLRTIVDMNLDYDEMSRGNGRNIHNNLPRFISLVKSLKDKYGFIKASDEAESTGRFAYNIMTGNLNREEALAYGPFIQKWGSQNQDYALEAIEYVKSQDRCNSFMINLKQICENGFFTQRSFGILAAIVQVYDAYKFGSEQRKIEQQESTYQGNAGDKLSFEVTVMRKRVTFGAYNMQTWLLMKDNSGNVITWSASKELEDIFEGDTIVIKGTVKTHKDYNDIKQTVLTRCKYEKK